MTKKDLKQVTAILKAVQNTLITYSDYPLKLAVTERDPGDMKIEIDCYFQHRAVVLLLFFDEFSTFHTKIEESVLIMY